MGIWHLGRARRSLGKKKAPLASSTVRRSANLCIEPLEERLLFSIAPTLVSIITNIPTDGAVLSTTSTTVLDQAPQQLIFKFDDGQTINPATLAAGIQIVRAGGDGIIGNANDVSVQVGFEGVPEQSNQVVVRFLNTLPDDTYQITVNSALKNSSGQALSTGTSVTTFKLDYGAQVSAVVPQPIVRTAQGTLQQMSNQIQVYFTNDTLNPVSAQTAALYQLIYTGGATGTATTNDDVTYTPTSVSYNPATNMATLTFAQNLDQLGSGLGTYRLRIGDNSQNGGTQTVAVTPDQAGTSFATALQLGTLTSTSKLITGGAIEPPGFSANNGPNPLVLPGGPTDPGQANLPTDVDQSHFVAGVGADSNPAISTLYYNFQRIYGTDSHGNPLINQITAQQEQDVRDIFTLWGHYLGVQFVETATSGLTVATGDTRAVTAATTQTGANGVEGLSTVSINGVATTIPAAIMSNLTSWGNSEYGGTYFQTAMQQIGRYLGLSNSNDLPGLQAMGNTAVPANTNAPEPVLPGDFDILDGQYLYNPSSKDINVYSFTLSSAGTFSAETIAQQAPVNSLLNTVLTLYDSAGNVVARNDDYFGADSFVNLSLPAGQYSIAVTSTGNTNFNPKVLDSGSGGTTQGAYDLQLSFTPIPAATQLLDVGGQALDGDLDGVAGGDFNFWFQVGNSSNTIFVDKVAANGGTGSITSPFNNIATALTAATALSAAQPGVDVIVRIEGNGGTDGVVSTLADDKAYEIGTDILGNPLPDGATMNVPQGVTVMIDAGAIFKLRGANINAGTFAQGVNLSGGAIQVLGTTQQSAYFTSYNNSTMGVPTNPLGTAAAPGDWGGIVYQADSDYEQNAVFLNYVAHADISYGGGAVNVDGQQQVYDPIYMVDSRPTLIFNNIHDNADAAMSADPDSFQYSLFQSPGSSAINAYTADYSRAGPVVHGNVLARDSINGLFIRIRTNAGEPIDVLDVTARLTATDIVYVLSQNLEIQGQPGGAVMLNSSGQIADPSTGAISQRLSAGGGVGGLIIDPGVIIKSNGSRIEVGVGAQLIAEGTSAKPIVFTSLNDSTYGAGGVFNTTGFAGAIAQPGDWGGLYFSPTSTGSLDDVEIAYGGGTTAIEGGFAKFNAVEIYQASVRIADSVLENNANGSDSTDRNGRLPTGAATIYVIGAQPVIVNNIIRNNAGDAISINANSLNAENVPDWGRSTGAVDQFTQFNDNYGPLVRLNVVVGNTINGMEVRGGELDTQSIWDDTDIVHVLQSNIDIPNFESVGGLELKSSPTQSLVVKLLGSTAGFTADGAPLDNSDRIGGALEVLGTPGHAVVLTALGDNTVGAGVDLNGNPQVNTVATVPATDTWNGILLTQNSNDRNVATVNELEPAYTGTTGDSNGTPNTAQALGALAPDLLNGDETRRLGFQVDGSISYDNPADQDVYSFQGTAGTQVWFQISNTTSSLNTVISLVDATGKVLATSDNALAESQNPSLLASENAANSVKPAPLELGDFSAGADSNGVNPHLYSENTKDAGFRLSLPGTAGTTNTYYIRVGSANQQTSGQYQLQVRLQEQPEVPGSTVQFADIRNATNAIVTQGLPDSSPLTSTSQQNPSISNTTLNGAQDLGNLLSSDQNVISLSSALVQATDVEWYKFNLNAQALQSLSATPNQSWGTVFDISDADGLSRPNLTLSVFDSLGNLLYVSRNSNVADGQQLPGESAESSLAGGSFGNLDPFLGTVQLAAGASATYYVAISSDVELPTVLNQTFLPASTNPLVRLQPIDSTQDIVDDNIGSTGTQTSNGTVVQPSSPAILPINDQIVSNPNPTTQPGSVVQQLAANIVPYALADVPLFVSRTLPSPTNDPVIEPSRLYTVNAATGAITQDIGYVGNVNTEPVTTLTMRSDGILYSDIFVPKSSNTAGALLALDPTTAQPTVIGKDNIPDVGSQQPFTKDQIGPGLTITALTFVDIGNTVRYEAALPADTEHYGMYYVVTNPDGTSHLFFGDPTTGEAKIIPNTIQGPIGDNFAKGDTQPGDGTLYMDATTVRQDIDLIMPAAGSIVSGQTFTVEDGLQNSVTYQFQVVGKPGTVTAGDVQISILGTETPDQLTPIVAQAIQQKQPDTFPETKISNPGNPPNIPSGNVRVFEVEGASAPAANAVITTPVVIFVQPDTIETNDVGTVTGIVDVQKQGLVLSIPSINTVIDGQTFSVSDSSRTVTFQLQLPNSKAVLPPNAIAIKLTGTESLSDMQTEIGTAIASSGLNVTIPTTQPQDIFFATNGGIPLEIDNAFDASSGTTQIQVESLPNEGWSLYGVTATGQFITMANEGSPDGFSETLFANGVVDPNQGMVTSITNLGTATAGGFSTSTPWAGLAMAPQDLYNGALQDVMFAITTNGDIYAINFLTQQLITTIPGTNIPLFPNGANHVSTGLTGATGLAFSTVDANLWHPTNQDATDPGHGSDAAPDGSSAATADGGSSYYFGLEATGGGYISYNQPDLGVVNPLTNFGSFGVVSPSQPWGNTQYGFLQTSIQSNLTAYTPDRLQTTALPQYFDNLGERNLPAPFVNSATLMNDTIEGNNYNAPGGAHGSLITNAFSLQGYSAADLPTLYFNYQLGTGTTSNGVPTAAAQAFASTDNGATWHLVATNQPSQLPANPSVFANNGSGDPNQGVQPLFNTVGTVAGTPDLDWRQARVDLSPFAGASNVELKFVFTAQGTANNNFKGFSIDDIVVGLAERGEMVTQPAASGSPPPTPDTSFTLIPASTKTLASESLVGPYELQIRSGQAYASTVNGTSSSIAIQQPFISNNTAPTYSLLAPSAFAITVLDPDFLVNGQTFTIADGNSFLTFEIAENGVTTQSSGPTGGPVGPNFVAVPFIHGESAADLARSISAAINGQTNSTNFKVAASLDSTGTKVFLAGATAVDTTGTPAIAYTAQINDGDKFTVGDGTNTKTFEFDNNNAVTIGDVRIPFSATDSPQILAAAILSAINGQTGSGFGVSASIQGWNGQTPVPSPAPTSSKIDLFNAIMVDATNAPGVSSMLDSLPTSNARLVQGYTLVAPGAAALVVPYPGLLQSGQTFSISDGTNSLTFEFDTAGKGAATGNISILFSPTETAAQLANSILLEINKQTGAHFAVSGLLDSITQSKIYLTGAKLVNTTGTPALAYTAQIADGDKFVVGDGVHNLTFEFDDNGSVANGDIAVPFQPYVAGVTAADSPLTVATNILKKLSGANGTSFSVLASIQGWTGVGTSPTTTGNFIDLQGAQHVDTSGAKEVGVLKYTNQGDTSVVRSQGEVIIANNRITDATEAGIVVEPAIRGPQMQVASTLPVLNSQNLAPGIVIENNIIDTAGVVGIQFGGDPDSLDASGNPVAPAIVPFGRIVNNTIYGAGAGTGIQVMNHASPTLMNNILANLNVGISVDPTSQTTVLGANLYKSNTAANVLGTSPGTFDHVDLPTDPLFVNAANHNFNLLERNSAGVVNYAIDSAQQVMSDRAAMVTVNAPIGIGPSPIIAPSIDETGKLRIADHNVPPNNGTGSNVFIDRGALDRSDFTGPTATLLNPADNSSSDQDPALNSVLYGASLPNFQIQLSDGTGSGVDPSTVSAARFVITRDGVPLVLNTDYTFSYDATNNVARFVPTSGIWASNHTYVITVDNSVATGIKDLAANPLLPTNATTGVTQFTISLQQLDFGAAPAPYPTTLAQNGARHIISDGLFLGSGVTPAADGNPNANADNGLPGDGVSGLPGNLMPAAPPLIPGTTATITVTASQAGFLDAWMDFKGDGSWADAGDQIFTSQPVVAGANILHFQVPLTDVTSTYARFRISSTGGLSYTGVAPDGEVEDYEVNIQPTASYTVVLANPTTHAPLPKDANGNYVILAGSSFEAQVYVTDTRGLGSTGGIQNAYADLARDLSNVTFTSGSLVVNTSFPTNDSGTVNSGLIDEAGGIRSNSPTGSGVAELLFTVDGTVAQTTAPGTVVTLSTAAATGSGHDTQVFGSTSSVASSYGTATLIVPLRPWQNPVAPDDVNNDGFINILDIVKLVGEMNVGFGGTTGLLPSSPVAPNIPPPYVDVNGDGSFNFLDLITELSYINTHGSGPVGNVMAQPAALATSTGNPATSSPASSPAPVTPATSSTATINAVAAAVTQPIAAPMTTGTSSTGTSATVAAPPAAASGVTAALLSASTSSPASSSQTSTSTSWSASSVVQASAAASSQSLGAGTTSTASVKPAATSTLGPVDFARSQLFAAHSDDADTLDLDQPMLAAVGTQTGSNSDRKTTLSYVG